MEHLDNAFVLSAYKGKRRVNRARVLSEIMSSTNNFFDAVV
jgi:hypothetical protein